MSGNRLYNSFGLSPWLGLPPRFLYEIYSRGVPHYTGRVTVPVLWDKTTETIVNNESSEIIRMFNSAFDACGATAGDFYPEELRAEIDALNTRIYSNVNNGVYKAGFATTQKAYEIAFVELFETLDFLEERLALQLLTCFEVRSLSGGLVSSAPE